MASSATASSVGAPSHILPTTEALQEATQKPRFVVSHGLNKYDNSQFGDRVFALLNAYLIAKKIAKKFPNTAFCSPLENDYRKLKIHHDMASSSLLKEDFDFTVTVEIDRNSSIVEMLAAANREGNTFDIDLSEVTRFMSIVSRNASLEIVSSLPFEGHEEFLEKLEETLSQFPTATRVAIDLPYATFSPFDQYNFVFAEGRAPLMQSFVDLKDPSVREILRQSVQPSEEVGPIDLVPWEEGCKKVVLSIRGASVDLPDTIRRYPAKFPSLARYAEALEIIGRAHPDVTNIHDYISSSATDEERVLLEEALSHSLDWYILALEELRKKYPTQERLNICIATNVKKEQLPALKATLERLCQERGIENISFIYGKGDMLQDLWGTAPEALIAADSAFAALIGLSSPHLEVMIMPKPYLSEEMTTLRLPREQTSDIQTIASGAHRDVFQGVATREMQGHQLKVDMSAVDITDFRNISSRLIERGLRV